ncbi:MAG TPA: alpha/beta hydrolase, partial [Candidatus Nanopelagicales bacterium]|nr:alpha/beta hydrolase [Candidatus Nanopelagicales bacterium]
MVVETSGTGDDVVLVHGALSWGRDTFAGQLHLADRVRLHVVDRRGYVAAGPPVEGEVGWPVDVPDLIALLERLGGAHLVGHSYGGVDALIVAGERPDLV